MNTSKDNLVSIDLGLYPATLVILDEIRGLIPRRTYIRNILELHCESIVLLNEDEDSSHINNE